MEIQEDVYVRSVGSSLPRSVSVDWAIEQGLYDPAAVEMCRLTATSVAEDVTPADMTVEAARTALRRAGADSKELDALIHSSVFPPGPAGWSLAGYTLRELGGSAPVTELRTGCSAMLSAMELTIGLLTGAARHRSVLLTGADVFGPWIDRWGSYSFIGGDGASAALLGTEGGFARIRSVNSRTLPQLEMMQRGAESLFPSPSAGRIDEQGRLDHFVENVMSTVEAASLMAANHAELTRLSVAEAGIGIGDLTKVVFHNMSRFVVEQFVMAPLGLPMERSCFDLGAVTGHLGVSDQLVSLERLLLDGQLAPGDHVLLLGGSAGFATVAIVLEILERPDWARGA
ncbi:MULTISPECIES: ketoacyl-ACP synthase III family protein [unclassified Streptomyces]|uniref:ketoacyl-ACP synthase III family protein n=1 Tax=unclassified Streptomyces TaxID=2593676 RepID=UPI000DB96469|nr:ketoacyl-ACP synthase III family protein [Streptomyces sp. PsTaAH-130]MYU03019.1 3-oxoacyl-ACP synthase [Streptomyces sp. SID8366]MYU62114.1 3-oxoacyl-ACP synthase [Streptomyces sp. SID69]RAJ51220.1 3-oxoacyl-[acyl-carrier-protein] synthase-3 [Streptomyces sp. PsTaAH-130]